jgi:hypothetical protein
MAELPKEIERQLGFFLFWEEEVMLKNGKTTFCI